MWRRIILFSFLGLLAACAQQPPVPGMKVGKPYVVDGKSYYPEYDPTYDKIGEASWYGPGFHGKYTASGEVFNQNALTAAHPTLPMPSLVRVTNLSNGKSVIVRVNDRGPFKSNRIIDLSKKSAESIGLRSTGQVRVQYLKSETEEYIASLQHSGAPISMAQYNQKAERAKNNAVIASTAPAPASQPVSDTAPVLSVSSGDLAEISPKSHGLVRDAMADDMTSPPPQKAPEPKVTKVAQVNDEASSAASSDLHPKAQGHYIVQAGAFSAEENARKLMAKLEGIASIVVDKVAMGEKTWWRVRLGPFNDQQSADDALAKARVIVADARIIHQ
ncbi:MAG: septal ring lytic transglycosylase RlpA family protein [Pseudomonadota bacterium]|nr:septal ring lytic transglycosylase RlpA family protein [Pseudomonadota bacterium]